MKKIISFTFAIVFFAVAGVSNADTCGADPLPPCVSNGNPLQVMQAWGLTGANTKIVLPGTTIVDDGGLSVFCNPRVDVQGCSDLTGLDYYKNQQIATAKKLIETGRISQFPIFQFWVKFVK